MTNISIFIVKISIFLGIIIVIILVNMSFKREQRILNIEKRKYDNYIVILNNLYSNKPIEVDKKILSEKFIESINFLENSKIVNIEELSELENKVNTLISIKKDYFMNLLNYLYDNNNSFYVEEISFNGVKDSNIRIKLIVSFLYSIPSSDIFSYFRNPEKLEIIFWEEQINKLQNAQTTLKQQEIVNNQEINDQIHQEEIRKQEEKQPEKEFSLEIKYKGTIKMSNKNFAIVEYENKDLFLEQGKIYKLGEYNVEIFDVSENLLIIVVDGRKYEYKVEWL